MDRFSKLILILVLVVIGFWRLKNYLRLAMSTRRVSIGSAGGWFPLAPRESTSTASAAETDGTKAPLLGRTVGFLVVTVVWLALNTILWFCLLELPPLKNVPPIIVGTAGIFANFYLVPFARGAGIRVQKSFEKTR